MQHHIGSVPVSDAGGLHDVDGAEAERVALAMASLAAVEQGQAAGVLMVAPVIITAPHGDRFGNVLSEADSAFGWATRHGGDGIISF